MPSDAPMTISMFVNAFDGVPKPYQTSWDRLVQEMGPHRVTTKPKVELPAFSPAEYRPGMPRLERNVLKVHFGVLDLDKLPAQAIKLLASRLEGLDAFLYTSYSHPQRLRESGLWSMRCAVRLSRPIQLAEWPSFWRTFAGHFGVKADPQCKDPCRVYFGPYVPPDTDMSLCHYVVYQGEPLDVSKMRLDVSTLLLTAQEPTDKISRDRLGTLAKAWKRSRKESTAHMGEALARMCRGEPFAEDGNVDTTLFQLCQDLVRALPRGSAESIASHFAQSLQLMSYGKAPHTLQDVREKLERAQQGAMMDAAEEELEALSETRLRIQEAFASVEPDRDWPYTEEELQVMTAKLMTTRDELKKRWLIQRGTSYYVLGPGAVYSPPYSDKDIGNAVLRDLAPAKSAGVELRIITQSGLIRKSPTQLMGDYGSVATDYQLDMRAQEARYDGAARVFIEAPCPIRQDLEPVYDPQVDQWLACMAGEQVHEVRAWISMAMDLGVTCAALMLTGPGDTGKGLLAHGLARIWTKAQPTHIAQVLGAFNSAVARCPLVFADEQIPKDFRGNGRTSELRELIGTLARPYTRKNAHDGTLLGALRVLIAANNENVLSFHENLSKDDIQAIADRIIHVQVQKPAIDFLRRVDAASFVIKDRIANHALWLRDNYQFQREGRFQIKSRTLQTVMALSTKGGIRSAVCQWLVGYLKEPMKVDAMGDYRVRIKGGRLLVNTEGILVHWDRYVRNEATPTAGKLAQAVGALSEPDRAHAPRPNDTALHYRVITTGHLYAWADQTEFMTRQEIDAALLVDTEARQAHAPGRALALRSN